MAKHFITIDKENRIIDGFSDHYREPKSTDICIRENAGNEFELFGHDPNRPLAIVVEGCPVWLYKYVGNKVEYRSNAEIDADWPDISHKPTVEERLETAEYNIETLDRVLVIMLGGDPDA